MITKVLPRFYESQSTSTSCVMFRKNNLFLARLPERSANSNENNDVITSQAFANISGNFRKISGNVKFPESLQPCLFAVGQLLIMNIEHCCMDICRTRFASVVGPRYLYTGAQRAPDFDGRRRPAELRRSTGQLDWRLVAVTRRNVPPATLPRVANWIAQLTCDAFKHGCVRTCSRGLRLALDLC